MGVGWIKMARPDCFVRLQKYKNVKIIEIKGMDHYYKEHKEEVMGRTMEWMLKK